MNARPAPHLVAFVLGAVFVTVGLGAPAWAISRFEHSLPSGDLLTPAWEQARQVLMFAPLLGPVLLGVWLFVHLRRALSGWRPPARWATLLTLLGLTLFGAYVVAVLGAFSPRNWLFGSPTTEVSVTSPDGSRTAHLAVQCALGCALHVYFEERGAHHLRSVGSLHGYLRDKPLPAVDWSADSRSVTLRPLDPATFAYAPGKLTFP